MRILASLRCLPLLLAIAAAPACTTDDPPKLVAVSNETAAPHHVQFGAVDMGEIAAHTKSTYLEVADGVQAVLVDGQQRWKDTLGSDNVGGMWTLYLQSAGTQLVVGIALDDDMQH